MKSDYSEDIWTLSDTSSHDDGPASLEVDPRIETLHGVEPLIGQVGQDAVRCVPDVLHVAIFGQPRVDKGRTETAASLPAKTYAIFDAAKIVGLPEMLEGSGLEHRCLFKGKALESFGDVAPWIVSLEEENSFVRKCFTCGSEPWHLWDKDPGIFIRSNASFDELWGHFRKFTRIYDEVRGKWLYWRFWDAAVLRSFISELAPGEHRMFSQHIEAFVGCTRDGRCTIITYGD